VQDGQTVLHLAAMAGRTDTVEALLDRGCDPNIQDFVSFTSFAILSCSLLIETGWL
jgi:ankyrin repeat protein